MTDNEQSKPESTLVDDVRRVREKIAGQHRGDFQSHREETNRIFEELREKLHVKVPPPPAEKHDATAGS